ncbi:hypothetical protein KMC60_gp30 [Achromobacter phage vB_AxyP_19-32_Axy11]|uniref:Uncharacterized protein n=1 Tax=Achromobacter phage vB_AxyP_19-32_Axy11 TaxID=2591042 RepID=A0A514CU90_9CAUD|nr:hypothetical protein KMC60_gp30 [Achromobacter phage vB_AxyP_19-32_Axy11]QDH84039.1 hypothetical protein Axy11_030 [Achromobacter phage vB_AxyP_19-32_Axy11]
MEVWYRYEQDLQSGGHYDLDGEFIPGVPRVGINLIEYTVIKYTPKGVWLNVLGRKRFVLHQGRKKFAHADKKDAVESFVARKDKQIRILQSQQNNAITARNMAIEMLAQIEEGKEPCPPRYRMASSGI